MVVRLDALFVSSSSFAALLLNWYELLAGDALLPLRGERRNGECREDCHVLVRVSVSSAGRVLPRRVLIVVAGDVRSEISVGAPVVKGTARCGAIERSG